MKINCTSPHHDDRTASMEIYEDAGYCFSCGWVDRSIGDIEHGKKKDSENIEEKIKYILSLPKSKIRGLLLPSDLLGYYIVWPDNTYYKCRTYSGQARYIGPRGHRAPLYKLGTNKDALIIVEGELNALSLYEAKVTQATVVSPGSANEMLRHLDTYLTYSYIAVIVDYDRPGISNGLRLKDTLLKRGKQVRLLAVTKDLNQLYEEKGKEGIKEWWKEMGMLTWL